jgi:hypothetical protein
MPAPLVPGRAQATLAKDWLFPEGSTGRPPRVVGWTHSRFGDPLPGKTPAVRGRCHPNNGSAHAQLPQPTKRALDDLHTLAQGVRSVTDRDGDLTAPRGVDRPRRNG